ncbi:hypothetical protein BpHYR1_038543 [Brachionus plicatilis]|uniref:Uncharacterized protein n=1 Tax=Brachionus plicatilis TaxID=10195 RepID=A0A3M7SNU8_BRAPC|nr:hypothetical protein BpHYR1_038543 [Brachionus plicatilis]
MNDIMIHGIPDVSDANERLRHNLEYHKDVLGLKHWLRVTPDRPEQTTSMVSCGPGPLNPRQSSRELQPCQNTQQPDMVRSKPQNSEEEY